jgi:membrane-associated phospholipid phosphatase
MSRDRSLQGQNVVSQGLRSPGWLAQWPLVGVLMIVIGSFIFGALAYNLLTAGPLLQWDESITDRSTTQAQNLPDRILEYLIFGFFVGKELLQVIVIVLLLYFFHKRFWPEFAMLLIGSGGGAIIWYLIIRYFDRPRPTEQIVIHVTDPSFPSGHAISSVICYGLLAYLFIPKMPSQFWKWLVGIAAVFTILYVGYSRLYLGGHYLTDIIAGYGLGLAWAGLVFTLIERISLKRLIANAR